MNHSWRQSSASAALRRAVWLGIALWLAATIPIVLVGDRLLAPIDDAQGITVVLVATAVTAALLVWLTRTFQRSVGLDPLEAGLVLGVGAGGTGLALDALLLLVGGFDYPGVSAANTPTLAVALMGAYAAFVVVPALTGLRRPRTRASAGSPAPHRPRP